MGRSFSFRHPELHGLSNGSFCVCFYPLSSDIKNLERDLIGWGRGFPVELGWEKWDRRAFLALLRAPYLVLRWGGGCLLHPEPRHVYSEVNALWDLVPSKCGWHCSPKQTGLSSQPGLEPSYKSSGLSYVR